MLNLLPGSRGLSGRSSESGPAPTILGLDPTLFYEIVGALVPVIIIAVALVYQRSRKPKRTGYELVWEIDHRSWIR